MYLLNYSLETNEPAQFAVYVNNVVQPDTVTGTNAGSGSLVSNSILKLKKNDSVTVRNYTSSVIGGAVTIIQFAGGPDPGQRPVHALQDRSPPGRVRV